jgi:methylthioribulose-1-phosphate dehydratase
VSPLDPLAAARALAAVSRRLWERGFVEATSGNFSVRLDPERILVTATGKDKATLGPEDVVVVDRKGDAFPGEKNRPSYETKIHARTYEATNAGAVLHAHPPHVVALSTAVEGAILLQGLELVKAFAGVKDPALPLSVPVVDNDQDMERMSRACAAALRPPVPAVVLRGHGATVFGADLDEAVRHLEALEALAHLVILQRTLGVKPWRS